MVNYWLAKQEPDGPRGYNILQLKKDKKTIENLVDKIYQDLLIKISENMMTK